MANKPCLVTKFDLLIVYKRLQIFQSKWSSQEIAGVFSHPSRREKRDARMEECTSKCCSRPMKVNIRWRQLSNTFEAVGTFSNKKIVIWLWLFRKLEGFSFIFQPEEFDASHCRGRCPPRYHPLNDHSLLQVRQTNNNLSLNLFHNCKLQNFQSLLHLQSSRDSSGRPSIRRPCCAPSKYSNIDILHLDQVDLFKPSFSGFSGIIHDKHYDLIVWFSCQCQKIDYKTRFLLLFIWQQTIKKLSS